MNRCHVCTNVAVHSDAALCLTCSAAADRGEVVYDPDSGWQRVITVLGSDPYDDREGPYFSQADLKYLRRLSPGTKLTIVRTRPEAALPTRCDIEVSAVREGS